MPKTLGKTLKQGALSKGKKKAYNQARSASGKPGKTMKRPLTEPKLWL